MAKWEVKVAIVQSKCKNVQSKQQKWSNCKGIFFFIPVVFVNISQT